MEVSLAKHRGGGIYSNFDAIELIFCVGPSLVGNFPSLKGQPPLTPLWVPGGGAWGAQRGIPPNIMCYVNSGVFNSGEFKNDLHF